MHVFGTWSKFSGWRRRRRSPTIPLTAIRLTNAVKSNVTSQTMPHGRLIVDEWIFVIEIFSRTWWRLGKPTLNSKVSLDVFVGPSGCLESM